MLWPSGWSDRHTRPGTEMRHVTRKNPADTILQHLIAGGGHDGRVRLRLLGVHEHKQDPARLCAAIDPGMVRRLLHDHVALLEMYVAVIEHHVDLAGQDDGVIETACAMHQGMLDRNAFGR